MLHIYFFNQTPFPEKEESYYRTQNMERLKVLLGRHPETRNQMVELEYHLFSAGVRRMDYAHKPGETMDPETAVIGYFELFSRIKICAPYILVFKSLSDICAEPVNSLKVIRRWKELVDPDLKVYFLDYGFADYDEVEEKLHEYYKADMTGTRLKNLMDIFAYTMSTLEKMRNDDSPTATLGQPQERIQSLRYDYNRYVSMKAVADYIREGVRSLNKILNLSEGSDYSRRGEKIGKILTLSEEQKALIDTAMEKDFQDARERIRDSVICKQLFCRYEDQQITLEEVHV